MFDEPIIESMMDFSDSLSIKVQRLQLHSKTLSEVKENARKWSHPIQQQQNEGNINDFGSLQERKFALRKPKTPIIIFSEVDIKQQRESVRVSTVVSPQIDKSLLFVEMHHNTKSCMSVRLSRKKHEKESRSGSARSIKSNESRKKKN